MKKHLIVFITGLTIGILLGNHFNKTVYQTIPDLTGASYGHAKITLLPVSIPSIRKNRTVDKENFTTPESTKTPQIDEQNFKVESPAKNQTEESGRDFVAQVPIQGHISSKKFSLEFTGLTEVKKLGDDIYLNTTYKAEKLTLIESPWAIYAGLKWDGQLMPLVGVEGRIYRSFYGEVSVSNTLEAKLKYKF
jgi:hypothetical protein